MQVSVREGVKGAEVASAVLEHIRSNDVAVMEGCDKVGVVVWGGRGVTSLFDV